MVEACNLGSKWKPSYFSNLLPEQENVSTSLMPDPSAPQAADAGFQILFAKKPSHVESLKKQHNSGLLWALKRGRMQRRE